MTAPSEKTRPRQTYCARTWENAPLAQKAFGEALIGTGQKHKDQSLVRQGVKEKRAAAQAGKSQKPR